MFVAVILDFLCELIKSTRQYKKKKLSYLVFLQILTNWRPFYMWIIIEKKTWIKKTFQLIIFYILFEIVIIVTLQSIFHLKIYQNIFFYFLKIIFDINTLKRYKNIIFFYFKQKKFKIFKNMIFTLFQNHPLINMKSQTFFLNQSE